MADVDACMDAYADTDTEDAGDEDEQKKRNSVPKLFRMSSRVASMKRRGKHQEPIIEDIELEYYADDHVTVRAPDGKFFLARVLEDVLDDAEQINIAWYDLVGLNRYKVSYDDIIYKATVITQVQVKENKDSGLYSIPSQYLQETKQLLREAVGDIYMSDEDDGGKDEIDDTNTVNKDVDADEPPKKKARTTRSLTKPKVKRSKAPKVKSAQKKKQPKAQKYLIPNPDIALIDKDPVFEEANNIPLISVKWGIKAVLRRDMKELKRLLKDTKNIFTVDWPRSPHILYGPTHYALLHEDRDALQILHDNEDRGVVKAEEPKMVLEEISTGKYDFHTFGHAVRQITVSRGNQEGNNAFLADTECKMTMGRSEQIKFAFKNNLSFDFIIWYFNKILKVEDHELYEHMNIAIKYGHYKLAGEIMAKAVEADSYGYNFLHKEVLCSTKKPLSKFKSPSVTKKPYSLEIYPLHCACINPNTDYMQQLFAVHPEYTTPDYQQRGPIHYAAVCEGDGPLKYLLSRGVDPNSHDKYLTTPLMVAAKTGRVHNIQVLMESTFTTENDNGEEVTEKRVKINAKNKKSMNALHYAAKCGFVEAVETLLQLGANADLQTGAGKENMTALGFAAQKGHYDVVKVLVEKGASPDKKMRRSKTALMFACMNGHSRIVAYLLRIGVNPSAEDSSQNTPIHYASAFGWYHCVKILLEAGANADKPNNWRTTPLAVSILKGHMEISELLLTVNVNVDYADEKGRTLAMKQVGKNFDKEMLRITKFLVEEKHSDVNKTDIEGWNILHHLASNSVYDDQRYDTVDGGYYGYRPHFVKEKSDVCISVAEFLISFGVKCNAISSYGETPLMIAVLQKNFQLIHCLLKHGAKSSIGRSALHNKDALQIALTCYGRDQHEMIDLRELFPKKKSKQDEEMTVDQLEQSWNKNLKMTMQKLVEDLIENKCNMNNLSKEGESTLMMSLSCSYDITLLLLQNDANPLIGKNQYGENTLHLLAQKCADGQSTEILKYMIEKHTLSGKFVNMREHNGLTALHQACMLYSEHFDDSEKAENIANFINCLLACVKSVDVALQIGKEIRGEKIERRGLLSIRYQRSESDKSKEEEFKEYGYFGLCTAVHFLAITPHQKSSNILKEIFKRGNANLLNTQDRYGRTALHVCIKQMGKENNKNYESILLTIIDCGFDVNFLSADKQEDKCATPLSLATSNLSAVKLLLKASADPNKIDSCSGRSPLMYAVESKNEQKLEVIKCLLDAGGNVNACDQDGRSALHYAVNATTGDYETLTEVEYFLIENGARKDVIDVYGRLPLHYAFTKMGRDNDASSADPISIVIMLCKVKAKDLSAFGRDKEEALIRKYINCVDGNKRTSLHLAALQGATLCCLQLKKMNGCDTVEDCDGNTPLALALRGNHHGCAMILIQHGANVDVTVTTPVTEAELKCYEELLKTNEWNYNKTGSKPVPKVTSAFCMAIVNDWHGVAYLMMEMAGLPFIEAYKAAVSANKPQLLWTIMKKQRNKNVFLVKSEDKKTLLHLLACQIPVSCHAIAIAKILFEAGVKACDQDSFGANVLHYAADNSDLDLCEFILEKSPECVNMLDKNGKTPLLCVINDRKAGKILSDIEISLIKLFISKKATLNVCYRKENGDYSSLLNDIISLEDVGNFADDPNATHTLSCLSYFIEKGIDTSFVPNNDKTAVMCAVLQNMESKLKMLLRQKKPNLDHQDKNGNCCVHHCVQTNDYWSHENLKILQMLIKAKASINLKNNNGETPLDLAGKQKSRIMHKELLKYKAKSGSKMQVDCDTTQEHGFHFNTTVNEYCDFDIDIKADSEKEIANNIEGNIIDANERTKVDSDIENAENAEIYIDPITGVPYDALLSKVDCRWGIYGLNNFYKLQVVCDKGRCLWILFNKWGRVGLRGQHQQTPFYTADEAAAELKKIFKSKTGNDWENIDSFSKKPKKYSLVRDEKNPEKVIKHHKQALKPFDLKNAAPSKLPKELKEFTELVCNVTEICQLEDATKRDVTTLCSISKEHIDRASDVLAKIRKILEGIESEKSSKTFGGGAIDHTEAYEEIENLSNEFFMLLPTANYAYTRVRPINCLSTLTDQEKLVSYVTELSDTMKVLLGAQHNAQEINPLDYCFKALNTHIESLTPHSEEAQAILKSIYATYSGEKRISGIFRVNQRSIDYHDKQPNKHLLWHGTKSAHMISLLRTGFQLDPLYARNIGRTFGEGVYFSYEFQKAQGYSCGTNAGVVLLCEVALGKISNKCYDAPASANSLWLKTMNYPDPKDNVMMPFGAKLLAGNLIPDPSMKNNDIWYTSKNEIVVHDPKHIRMRYIVMLNS